MSSLNHRTCPHPCRDIKPLNVLIAANPDHPSRRGAQRGQGGQPGGRQAAPGRLAGTWAGAGEADVEAAQALVAGAEADVGPRCGVWAGGTGL